MQTYKELFRHAGEKETVEKMKGVQRNSE